MYQSTFLQLLLIGFCYMWYFLWFHLIILLIIIKFLFRETQEAKQELEKGREDLAQMMERLRADQAMEAEEKARLEEEINAKAEEVAEIQNAVKSKFLSLLPFWVVNCYQKNIFFSNFCCMFLNSNIFFPNLNYNCSNLLDMRNLQEHVKKAFCYQKLLWPFTVQINCSSDPKIFANSRPSASNFKSFSWSLEQFFLTVGQNNFGNKIPSITPQFLALVEKPLKCHLQFSGFYCCTSTCKHPHKVNGGMT